jgi:hypothetical protein
VALPRIDDDERRRRIAVRHALAPAARKRDATDVARAMTVLHATEAATVHLSVAARAEGVAPSDVDVALYDDRSVVKQLAMRRTLFVFPRDLLPAAWGSASARVAGSEERRVAKAIEAAGIAPDGTRWLEAAAAAVLERLASGPATTAVLRAELPELAGTVGGDTDKKWDRPVSVAPWVLTHLGLRGLVVRGDNDGAWTRNRPSWTRTEDWLGEAPTPWEEAAGYAELVRRWLATFGPGTAADVQWWLGSTKTAVTRALADVGAVEVVLDDGSTGWVLPDDVEDTDPVEPWAALLPTLDPTTMGWKARAHYLDAGHTPYLFDTNGNAGTTAWWDGRIVGAWVQDEDARVRVVPLPGNTLPPEAIEALDAQADRLTSWLAGVRISNVYSSQLMKGSRLP